MCAWGPIPASRIDLWQHPPLKAAESSTVWRATEDAVNDNVRAKVFRDMIACGKSPVSQP